MLCIWGIVIFMVVLGFLLIGFRLWLVVVFILDFCYYGVVEGWVVEIDCFLGDWLWLMLDQVVLECVVFDRMLRYVWILLFVIDLMLVLGQYVMIIVYLGLFNGLVEFGGFDFCCLVWFEGLGVVGYFCVLVLIVVFLYEGGMLVLYWLWMWISQVMMDSIGGQVGVVVLVLMMGDCFGIVEVMNDVMCVFSFYYIILILGLYMMMLVGFVYVVVCLLGVGVQFCGVLLGIRLYKWVVGVVLLVVLLYLWILGGGVVIEWFFIMVVVMLLVIIVDCCVVLLCIVVLVVMVLFFYMFEGMILVGFQMSFLVMVVLILLQWLW